MRLIDADALMRDIEKYHLSDGKFQHWVEVQPTIEPEIIRCKACKWWDTDYGAYGYCGRHGGHISTFREGYCHLAERR